MNKGTAHDQQHEPRPQAVEPDTIGTATEHGEKPETPEAVQVAQTSRAGMNDARRVATGTGRYARGVEWVRPTDLLARHGAALAGRGIDFEVELARRTRAPITAGTRLLGERARRLPPVSEFGRGSRSHSWVTRPGIGLR